MKKTFLVSFDLQRDEISTLCFDHCKAISIGSIQVELYEGLPAMMFLPCLREDCPYLERQLDEPTSVTPEYEFYLRKLKPLSEFIAPAAKLDQKVG